MLCPSQGRQLAALGHEVRLMPPRFVCDTKQIARELGVRYALEGSVRRSDNRVRVNAQLIDAATDAHLWTERFDGDTADLFALQDELTSRIATHSA